MACGRKLFQDGGGQYPAARQQSTRTSARGSQRAYFQADKLMNGEQLNVQAISSADQRTKKRRYLPKFIKKDIASFV